MCRAVREQPQPRSNEQQAHHQCRRGLLLPRPAATRTPGLVHPVTRPVVAPRTLRHNTLPFYLSVVDAPPRSHSVASGPLKYSKITRFGRIHSLLTVMHMRRCGVLAAHRGACTLCISAPAERHGRKALDRVADTGLSVGTDSRARQRRDPPPLEMPAPHRTSGRAGSPQGVQLVGHRAAHR